MPHKRSLPALLIAAALCAYIVYPVLAMLSEAFTLPVSEYRAEAMGWNVNAQPFAAPLRRMFAESNAVGSILRTLEISICTVIAGCAWGSGLALLWQRRDFPGRKYFAPLGFAPILIPPLVGTLAFFKLIGEGGALWFGGRPCLSGFSQVLLMHTYAFGIYAFAYVSAALEDADPSQEEAARSLGATEVRAFFAAVWPTIRPALLASAFITFMSAAASFSAPYILDNSSHYLTVDILNEQDDRGMQRAFSVVLAAIALSALPAFLYVSRNRFGNDVAIGKGAARKVLPPASANGAVVRQLLSVAAAVVLLTPLAFVVEGAAIRPNGTTQNVLTSIAGLDADAWSSLARSGWYAAAAALTDILLALAIALSLRRAAGIAVFSVEFCVMLALALPGSSLAVSLLSVFNGPSALTLGIPLGRTAAMLILTYAIRNLPLAVRPARAALQAVGSDLENAAAGLGAERPMVLWRVTLPLIFPSLLAAALICFITAAGEYVASALLYGANTKPVSVAVYELFRSSPTGAYALALCLMLASATVITVARLVRKNK